MVEEDELYVDLGGRDNTPNPNAPLMAMLHRLKQDMAKLRSQNDKLSLASEEQEN